MESIHLFLPLEAAAIDTDVLLSAYMNSQLGKKFSILIGEDAQRLPDIENFTPLLTISPGAPQYSSDYHIISHTPKIGICIVKELDAKLADIPHTKQTGNIFTIPGLLILDTISQHLVRIISTMARPAGSSYCWSINGGGPDPEIDGAVLKTWLAQQVTFDSSLEVNV